MSYETDNLKREIDSLKWQKAEIYKVNDLENTLYGTKKKLEEFENKFSYLEERLAKLEQKELERENEKFNI